MQHVSPFESSDCLNLIWKLSSGCLDFHANNKRNRKKFIFCSGGAIEKLIDVGKIGTSTEVKLYLQYINLAYLDD